MKLVISFVPNKQPLPPPLDDARCCNDRRSCKRASSRLRPRGVPRRELPSQPPTLCHPFRAQQPFRGSRNRPRSHVVPRSRLSRDYSRLSTTGSTRARAALTLAFSTYSSLSLSLSLRRPLLKLVRFRKSS